MNADNYFSKRVTLTAKGIAVVLMLFHHLFYDAPGLVDRYAVSFQPKLPVSVRDNTEIKVFFTHQAIDEVGAHGARSQDSCRPDLHNCAMHSISQSAPLGRSLTATQLLAGLDVKYLA